MRAIQSGAQLMAAFLLAGLLLAGILLAASDGNQEQDPVWPPIGKVVPSYTDKVLDILFPRTFRGPYNLLIVARFEPSYSPESQIVIYRTAGEQCCEVFLARARTSIHEEVARMVSNGIRDEGTMAKDIKVNVQKVQVPKAVVEEWISSFESLNFNLKYSGFMIVHGDLTELWYEGPDRMRMHFSYVDPFTSFDEVKSHPVVRWMNRVRKDVEKYADSAAAPQ